MCCLFGLLDYEHRLSLKRKNQILTVLAKECEARGTDASGIAYNVRGILHIYKKAVPAHRLPIRIPADTDVVMGHTRLATQGSAKRLYNDHPFRGVAGQSPFALAHNGVIRNDVELRRQQKLPRTKIETDSFIAVQLIEQKRALSFDSLRFMAEKLEGSFTITVLGSDDSLYIIKGDNPLYLLQMPRLGIFLYASTEEILHRALDKLWMNRERQVRIQTDCGELLRISPGGAVSRSTFNDCNLFLPWYPALYGDARPFSPRSPDMDSPWDTDYLEELKNVAAAFGYTPDDVELLARQGFAPEEVEDFLYSGEL